MFRLSVLRKADERRSTPGVSQKIGRSREGVSKKGEGVVNSNWRAFLFVQWTVHDTPEDYPN